MDLYHHYIIELALSMEVFADGDPTFKYGEWKVWRQACLTEGRMIPPAEYKARVSKVPKPRADNES